MAHLPGRPAECGLSRPSNLLLVLALAGTGASPGLPLTAQETPPAGSQEAPGREPPRAGALLEAGTGLTAIRGDVGWFARGLALVSVSPGLAFGGGAVLLPDRSVEGDVVFPDRELGFGYGGVVVEVSGLSPGASSTVSLRALLGAGNVDLRDAPTRTRLASDNIIVAEPEVVLHRRVASRLYLGASLSWRAVWGLDDIDGVDGDDLGGPSLGLSLRIGPF